MAGEKPGVGERERQLIDPEAEVTPGQKESGQQGVGHDGGWSDSWAGRTGIPEGEKDRTDQFYASKKEQPPPQGSKK